MKYPSKKHHWVIPINTRRWRKRPFTTFECCGSLWVPSFSNQSWQEASEFPHLVQGLGWLQQVLRSLLPAPEECELPMTEWRLHSSRKIQQQNMSQVTRFKMSSALLPQRTHKFQDWRSWPRISRYPFIFFFFFFFIHLSYSCTSASAAFSAAAFSAAAFSAAASSAAAVAAAAFLAASSFHPSSKSHLCTMLRSHLWKWQRGLAALHHAKTLQRWCPTSST